MAFTVTNSPVLALRRFAPVQLGSVSAVNQAVEFRIVPVDSPAPRRLVITAAGSVTTPTAQLEASIDGSTWFVVPAVDISAPGSPADTAAVFAARYDVSGLQAARLRFGFTAGTFGGAVSVFAELD